MDHFAADTTRDDVCHPGSACAASVTAVNRESMLFSRGQYALQRSHGVGRVGSPAKLESRDARDTPAESAPAGLMGGVGLGRLQPGAQVGTTKLDCQRTT